MESGIGTGVSYWDSFIPFAKQLNARVIVYSRAGNGSSDRSNNVGLKSSLLRLEKLLTKLNTQKNLIFVGHSFGAFHARNFAYYNPDIITLTLLGATNCKGCVNQIYASVLKVIL
ncbi:alpha/beta fold hydrolase [Glaciecola sp. MH2013]|uniref:alpha/beta fold hydrolase n=1 Tax=Glaciecola sp. MH2013 TaxID=2785524 RepID=UPI00351CA6F0